MPTIALPLGLLALAPFLWFGFGAVSPVPETAERMLLALIDYAALILAFFGGVQWGVALTPEAGRGDTGRGDTGRGITGRGITGRGIVRLLLAASPLVIAWVGLIVAQMVAPSVSLTVLGAGYLATLLIEHRIARQRPTPPRIPWLRWGIAAVAFVMMAMVLFLRGIGQTIVF